MWIVCPTDGGILICVFLDKKWINQQITGLTICAMCESDQWNGVKRGTVCTRVDFVFREGLFVGISGAFHNA